MRWPLALLAALALSSAVAQEAPPSKAPWFSVLADVVLSGGSSYCKASYDAGVPPQQAVRALCYAEYNLLQLGGVRLGTALRFDLSPVVRTTPLLLLDYTGESWFIGIEAGYTFVNQPGGYVGIYFGLTLPATFQAIP
jgi:hypothetical protein